MAIKLESCIGCGTCAIACKTENNTQSEDLINGRKYNWADFLTFAEGDFPNPTYKVYPVLCNHCSTAACVTACPVTPKAMFKSDSGVTIHNDERCIGCQSCVIACPYSDMNTIEAEKQYSVISYNPSSPNPHGFWENTDVVITGGTSSPAEVAGAADSTPPYKHNYTHTDYNAVRPANVTEKCIFCDHRVLQGAKPFCVDSCPTEARVFGDLDDASSDVNAEIAKGYNRLANNTGDMLAGGAQGTDPNVYYIGGIVSRVNEIAKIEELKKLHVYPNPMSNFANVEFDLEKPSAVTLIIFNVSGKEVNRAMDNEWTPAGKQKIRIDVSKLKSGSYICRMHTNDVVMTANIVVL